MGYLEGKDIINVSGRGRADTEFVAVTYKATVKRRAKTGPEAKKLAEPIIEKIKTVIHEYAKAGGIDKTCIQTTLKTDVAHNRNTGEPDGYECVYTLQVKGTNVSQATVIHDALTCIDGPAVDSPMFHVKNEGEVYNVAFQQAADNARAKFEAQCKALNLDPANYEVTSWSPQEREHHGKTLALRDPEESAKPIGIEPGKASLNLDVTFWFTRKRT